MARVNVTCPFCEQTTPVKKHGLGSTGRQRYRCQSCCRSFQLEYEYRACLPGMKEQIVDLTMNNAGIRDTARALHISINAVVRTLKNFRQLLELLSGFNVAFWCTDNFSAYELLPDEKHITGKLYTQRIERENLNLRNQLKRLKRKTIGYPKSAEMHDKIIGTFIEREHYLL